MSTPPENARLAAFQADLDKEIPSLAELYDASANAILPTPEADEAERGFTRTVLEWHDCSVAFDLQYGKPFEHGPIARGAKREPRGTGFESLKNKTAISIDRS